MIKSAGASVQRIGFNVGDQYFWDHKLPFTAYTDKYNAWPAYITKFLADNEITDIVLYGDTRFSHAEAIKAAKIAGITVHIFEEGYLRPYWVTYERGGVNGFSPLNAMTMEEIRIKRAARHIDQEAAPAQWGALWHHVWFGFFYHALVLFFNQNYRNFKSHRTTSLWKEWGLNAKRLALMPTQSVLRRIRTRRFLRSGRPFFVALLQLEHDASLIHHSDYTSQKGYVEDVISAFAKSAPRHHAIVFKAHPLDDGRAPIRKWVRDAAKAEGVDNRVRWIFGGKLGEIITLARGVLTINSTASQQALWRGLPVHFFGRSIFSRPDFVAHQTTDEFFCAPARPNKSNFLEFRSYLLETSQISGGFYTTDGRAHILRQAVDLLLAEHHPYDL